MKILITGSNGYIGSVMSEYIKSFHTVVGLDTDYFGHVKPNVIQTVYKDIRTAWINDMKGYDVVIHLAGLSNDPMGSLNEELTHQINGVASVNLAKYAKMAGVPRFIFSSSCSVYGDGSGLSMCDETSPTNPLTAYAKAKLYAEQEISKLADEDFSPVFMRNGTVYGVSPMFRTDLIVNAMTTSAYYTNNVDVYGDGSLFRPLVHVQDVCEAFMQVAEAPRDLVHNQVFNVGDTSENYPVFEVARDVCKVTGSYIRFFPSSGDTRSYRVDCNKISDTLQNFNCIWTVEDGVDEILDYLRDGEAVGEKILDLEHYRSRKFVRLDALKFLMDSGQLDDDLYWTGYDRL